MGLIQDSVLLYIFLGLFSLLIGSLLNLIIYRLPIMLNRSWENESRFLLQLPPPNNHFPRLNLFLPRSFCPNCKTMISFVYNIPILSYCLLRGKCKTCRASISSRYLFVECLSLFLALYAAFTFGFNLTLVFALLFIWYLISLFFIDLETQLLPDSLTLGLLWLGLLANTQSLFTTLPDAVFSAVFAYLGLWIFIQLFKLLRGKMGMGYGDFKLFAALGACFGSAQLPIILLFACFSGTLLGLIYLKSQNKNFETPIPFGPFLAVGGIVSLFWGEGILHYFLANAVIF